MKISAFSAAVLIASSTIAASLSPAASAPLAPDRGLIQSTAGSAVQPVQYRRYGAATVVRGPVVRGPVVRGNVYRGGGYRGGYRGGGGAALVGGLAAGAIIGGLVAASQASAAEAAAANDRHAYCASRYRSYDPASGTYVGRGGQRYYCQ